MGTSHPCRGRGYHGDIRGADFFLQISLRSFLNVCEPLCVGMCVCVYNQTLKLNINAVICFFFYFRFTSKRRTNTVYNCIVYFAKAKINTSN